MLTHLLSFTWATQEMGTSPVSEFEWRFDCKCTNWSSCLQDWLVPRSNKKKKHYRSRQQRRNTISAATEKHYLSSNCRNCLQWTTY